MPDRFDACMLCFPFLVQAPLNCVVDDYFAVEIYMFTKCLYVRVFMLIARLGDFDNNN